MTNVSVCMATYNGERYLPEQIKSILVQLGATDELVVVDDASKDGTVAYLLGLNDSRIKIHRNKRNLGHVQSFGKAVSLANNEIIVMADQDDIWLDGRVRAMCAPLEDGHARLVSANSDFIDAAGSPIAPLHAGLRAEDSRRYATNVIRIFLGKAPYCGCTMAFRSELSSLVLPIPSYVESHDLWIAMAANLARSNVHLEKTTLLRRVHGANVSVVRRPILRKLQSRLIFARSLLQLAFRIAVGRAQPKPIGAEQAP